jgi:hypothetical protein
MQHNTFFASETMAPNPMIPTRPIPNKNENLLNEINTYAALSPTASQNNITITNNQLNTMICRMQPKQTSLSLRATAPNNSIYPPNRTSVELLITRPWQK